MKDVRSAGPVAVGILGTGRMAGIMAEALALAPELSVVAVASSTRDRADVFAARICGGARAHAGREALLADPGVELVYIAGPTDRHAGDAIAALEAGKAVLVEKPLATSAEEARRAADAARSSGRFCMEAMWTPFLPSWLRLSEIAKAGEIGAPRYLGFSFGYPVDPSVEPRLFAQGTGSGVLLDRGIYGTALALKIFGPAKRVDALVEHWDGVDVAASLQLLHDAGALSQIAVSLTALLPNSVILGCTGGNAEIPSPALGGETVTVRFAAPSLQVRAGTGRKAAAISRLRRVPLLRRLKAMRSATGDWRSWGANMYVPMLSHVAERVRAGAAGSDVMPMSASIAALEILDQARHAGDREGSGRAS